MTRTLLLRIAIIGVTPAVLLALANLVVDIGSVFFRPFSFSFRLYRPGGGSFDLVPALQLSTTASLLIIVGTACVIAGIARIQPETPLSQTLPPTSSRQ